MAFVRLFAQFLVNQSNIREICLHFRRGKYIVSMLTYEVKELTRGFLSLSVEHLIFVFLLGTGEMRCKFWLAYFNVCILSYH